MEKFQELGLSENLLKVIKDKGFEKPSEVQERSIPLLLKGKDVVAGSATGSGKTLAFGSVTIQNSEKGKGIQGLILTPTRELAEQVANELTEFSHYKELEVVSVYGGVSINPQTKKLAYADIVVATPGRLLDHMNQNNIDLSKVKMLTLDEADRMWDMGFKEDVGKIVNACPKNRQTILFSATISHELEEFAKKYMKETTEVNVESQVDPSKLQQIYYDVRDDEKFSLLVHLLEQEKSHLVMIFSNTRRNADMVTKNLIRNNIDAQVIHGGMDQSKRNNVLKKFDNNTINVLVCTDVAARGLHIENVSHVYNYDVPSDARDYVHRIGRTARAGEEGIAINLIASRDYDNFANVQKHYPNIKIKREMTPNFKKVHVKIEPRKEQGRGGPRRGPNRGGNSRSGGRGTQRRGPSRGGSRGPNRGGSRNNSRGPNRGNQGRGRSDHRGGSRGRQQSTARRTSTKRIKGHGERNKRRNDNNRGPGRRNNRGSYNNKKPKTGFRGSGRNNRNRR